MATVPAPELGAVLHLLRDGRYRTRAELARTAGLSRSTIATRIDELLRLGLVAPVGGAESTGGRPAAMFALSPGARLVAGVDLGATHARVALTDLAGRELAGHLESLSIADGPDVVLDRVAALVSRLAGDLGRPLSDVVGVGVGLPGPVDHATGRPTKPPIMPGWDGSDVVGALRHRLGDVAVLVDNDVNLMALGEHATALPDVGHLLFVKVATGIGSGIVAEGRIHRGAQGSAGDLGHIAVPGAEPVRCTCGNTGCLEAIAGGAAVAARLTERGVPARTTSDVVELVRHGDLRAAAAVRDAGRSIGAVLAGCVSLLNPSAIVIGGSMSRAGEHLIAGIREVVYSRSLPLATQHLRVVTSLAGARAGVLGGAHAAVEHAFAEPSLLVREATAPGSLTAPGSAAATA
ncbi:ROK family protein [Isoptericola halotolerans]|uniref:NBD/HSP70 family sugar kinase n=1 Tax=Isoptericola halotolerans TaxID=300560 RepID=A0ABX1ZYH2_9MICO|nr:ROK family transcriptional regulator [Isoptericola halotolerans]NOV95584.1 putative NBD/HSP70 family sugar kinase [Isoptericola halotolerans]